MVENFSDTLTDTLNNAVEDNLNPAVNDLTDTINGRLGNFFVCLFFFSLSLQGKLLK